MDKLVMDRRASDNKYLHKDFHISMNMLLTYIEDNFGREAVIEYLKQFAKAYHKPLKKELSKGNLKALQKYFKDIYEKEEWEVNIELKDNELELTQKSCPGITHIKNNGQKPCSMYKKTYETVYETLCENTPIDYNLEYFNEDTGQCKQIFKKR